MATATLGPILHHLRAAVRRREDLARSDCELMDCFLTRRDEDAVEAIVRRHGPMVLGVCRRVLRNDADADDAFQATFLVFVRKAGSIRPRGMVGNWLYGVAHTTALKARAMSTRRAVKEREAAARARVASPENGDHLYELLDAELSALPDIYRVAIVLCDLEGKSIKDAAHQVDCPPGTIGTRLARGRRMLADRLARRGLILSGGAIGTMLAHQSAMAGVPSSLLNSTIEAATLVAAGQTAAAATSLKVAALMEGVQRTMLLGKLKATSAILIVTAVLGTGLGTVGGGPSATAQDKPGPQIEGKTAPNAQLWPRTHGERETGFDRKLRDPGQVDSAELKKASVDGQYRLLLRKIEVNADRETYGDFHDFGQWGGDSYSGHENLPKGYWVYVFPNWYIWGELNAKPSADEKKAAVDGKYSVLLKKIEVKTDRETYTEFHDFGAWSGSFYSGHQDLPPGYWVYVAPHWYIWGVAEAAKPAPKVGRQPRPIAPDERRLVPKLKEHQKASVEGKYRKLLMTIEMPEDREAYKDFHDYGYSAAPEYGIHKKLPPGYWVYVFPKWYIWSEEAK